jgi:hypothetical protein
MPEFPTVPDDADAPLPHMDLRDYAHFCERCLRSNASATAKECLARRADEMAITEPFRLVDPGPRPAEPRRP